MFLRQLISIIKCLTHAAALCGATYAGKAGINNKQPFKKRLHILSTCALHR